MSQTINTFPSWNGTDSISSFGVPNTATYGQTITVTAGAGQLDSFAFEIGRCTAAVTFRASVYAWNGTMATGSSLFQSGITSVPQDSSFHLVSFTTGGLTLAPGAYVLFASTSQDQAGNVGCQWGTVSNTVYPGGVFVYLGNGTNTASWTTATWNTLPMDLAFQANFSGGTPVVPIPGTVWLAVAGLMVMALLIRFGGIPGSSQAS